MTQVKVLIVDDHEIVLHGLKRALELEQDLSVIAAARSGKEALEALQKYRPDVALVDVKLNDCSGVELCRRITAGSPETAVVMLTAYSEEELVLSSIAAGAKGYLLKDAQIADIKKCIREVASGASALDAKVMDCVVKKVRDSLAQESARELGLSEQDLNIVRLIAEGLSNKEISGKIFLSPHTVKDHVRKIMDRLGVHRRTQIVAQASRLGII